MFKNKVILVTGGSAGIGAVTAEQFAKEGANVAIVGRNDAKLKQVAESCCKHGIHCLPIKADLSIDEEIDSVIKKAIDKFGKLDVLVNNAGILKKVNVTADNFLEVFDQVNQVNLRSAVRLTHFAVPYIIKTKGNIVNISSVCAHETGISGYIGYRTLKAALNHFTRSCAAELAEYGIRVNAISPGPVVTDIFEGIDVHYLENLTALKRVSQCNEIADLILYIASEKASSITGSNFIIDNGLLLI